MKRILLTILVAIAAIQSWGQTKLTPQQQIQILDKPSSPHSNRYKFWIKSRSRPRQ